MIRVVQTNEYRHDLLRARRPGTRTPLMELGTWVFTHGRDIASAPPDLLHRAYKFVQERLRTSHEQAPSRRTRSKIRWLTRWRELIERELGSFS